MAQEPALTFETFISDSGGIPYCDNFPIFFGGGALAQYYKILSPYRELQREAPDLEKRLREGISALPRLDTETLRPFYKDLYEAYLRMRKHVSSDTDLGLPPRTFK